tara:strand:+ start:347 stop:475 length:129 start_codon:yes stop_codon:yes gene_type:complete
MKILNKIRKVIAKTLLFVISVIGVVWLVGFAALVTAAKWLEE